MHEKLIEAQKAVEQALHASKFSPLLKKRRSTILNIQVKLQALQQISEMTLEMQNTYLKSQK